MAYWTVEFYQELDKVDASRRPAIIKKMERLQDTKSYHGIPLLSSDDKYLQKCFELKIEELRIIYHYRLSGSTINVLAIGQRSKKEVYKTAYHNLQKGR